MTSRRLILEYVKKAGMRLCLCKKQAWSDRGCHPFLNVNAQCTVRPLRYASADHGNQRHQFNWTQLRNSNIKRPTGDMAKNISNWDVSQRKPDFNERFKQKKCWHQVAIIHVGKSLIDWFSDWMHIMYAKEHGIKLLPFVSCMNLIFITTD